MFPDAITIDDALANAQRGIALERPAIVRPFFDSSSLSERHLAKITTHTNAFREGLRAEQEFVLRCQAEMRRVFGSNPVYPEHLAGLRDLTAFIESKIDETGGYLEGDMKRIKRQAKEMRRYLSPANSQKLHDAIAVFEALLIEEWNTRSDLAMFLRALYVEHSEDLSKAPVFDNPDDLAAFLDRAVG